MNTFFGIMMLIVAIVLTGAYWFEGALRVHLAMDAVAYNKLYRKLMVGGAVLLFISWLIVTFG